MNDYRPQLANILQALKKSYIDRDPANIDPFCELLFERSNPPIIIGTSVGEWCFGLEEARELFLSDWALWGNVSIDLPSLICGAAGPFIWFAVHAGVEYHFEDSDQRIQSYFETVRKISCESKPALARSCEIMWMLSHLLHTRKQERRTYIWDMTISGILKSEFELVKASVIQFSLPVRTAFPDVRIDADGQDTEQFNEVCRRINELNAKKGETRDDKLCRKLALLLNDTSHTKWAGDDTKQFVGLDGLHRTGREFCSYLDSVRRSFGTAEILPENLIVQQQEDYFWFCGQGVFSHTLSLENELEKILTNMGSYSAMTDRTEALFRLRRDLSLAMKDCTVSESHMQPFRIEGVGKIRDHMDIEMEYTQLSFPFKWILEQKTDAYTTV